MSAAELLFLGSALMIVYIYVGYPALVAVLALVRDRRVAKGPYEPRVTILISAFNEEDFIEATLRNKLALDYPREKLEIIVMSDASTDRTDAIVRAFEGETVRLLRQEARQGKTAALNMAVPHATGEILVFSDANSVYDVHALSALLENFRDPQVGYVTGKMIYVNRDGTSIGDGCTAYMKYENLLRKKETSLGSIVGVDGGIDAVRRDLYWPMTPDQLPDFVLPLRVVEQGYRVVYEPRAVLKEESLASSKDEYSMRVRVSLRALWALKDMQHLLSLRKFGVFAWQLWSHKALRYLGFVFLCVAYFSNLYLWSQGGFFKTLFILQNLGYLGAAVSRPIERAGKRIGALRLIVYFTLLNLASAHAFAKFLMGKRQVIWSPRKG